MSEWNNQLLEGVNYLRGADPLLAKVIESSPTPTFLPHKNYYQELVESIVSQQLSVKAASTILKRFKALFKNGFPSPEDIVKKDVEAFRSVGLSRQKAAYIHDLGEKVISKTINFEHLESLSNKESIEELTQVKGVGVWTVHMFLISCMGRFDVLPTGDLGIQNGVKKIYDLEEKPTTAEIEAIATNNNWHPYESIASWYIWQSLDNKPKL